MPSPPLPLPLQEKEEKHGDCKKTQGNVMLRMSGSLVVEHLFSCKLQARVLMGRSKLSYIWHYNWP